MTRRIGMADGLRKLVFPECVVGAGAAERVGRFARNLQARHALVVSDAGVVATGLVARVVASLAEVGIVATVFAEVSPNPRDHQVMLGVEACRRAEADLIIAVGGGSPMDCAKGIAVVMGNGGRILDYEGVDRIPRPGPPMICIPTTSGSAADISQFAIITDTRRRVKIALISKLLVPDIALVDPQPSVTMDAKLTACTGLDALTHAMEALVSTAHWSVPDSYAREAIRLVADSLVAAVEHPDDLHARGCMTLASMQAGCAFSNVSLGAVHAMAHSLGGQLDLPHGECNALLLEHVVRFNYAADPDGYDEAARALGTNVESLAPAERCEALVRTIRDLRHRAGIRGTLADRGLRREHLASLAEAALHDPCLITNPRKASLADLEALYAQAL